MKNFLVAVAILLSLATAATAQKQQESKSASASAQLEARVRKLWEAFKNKDKATLSSLIDDNFRQFEEGLSAFGDKKTEVNSVDEFELLNYTLTDFTIKSVGPNAALVTYIAQYEGKSGSEVSKGHSVFGEVWTRSGNEWKALYMQETYVK
jgi:hypothetical protein